MNESFRTGSFWGFKLGKREEVSERLGFGDRKEEMGETNVMM